MLLSIGSLLDLLFSIGLQNCSEESLGTFLSNLGLFLVVKCMPSAEISSADLGILSPVLVDGYISLCLLQTLDATTEQKD